MNKNNFEKLEGNFRRFSVISKEKISPIQWEEILELNNKIYLSYHVIISINNYIFIHGGIKTPSSLQPTNEFYRINMETYSVEALTNKESPYLSQHASVVLSNRYIVLIGGWNGHSRTSDIHIYDSVSLLWLKSPTVEGFPKGAGLSSHTANASLKSHSQYPDILIFGREGSTRIQRRYGNAYKLSCNSILTKFNYSELPLNVDSRSGHCTLILNSKIFIIGGRDDKVIDLHNMKDIIPDKTCNVVSNLIDRYKQFDLEICPLSGKRKAARRGHSSICGKNGFIVTGGSSFIEASHVADSASFLCVASSNGFDYYFLGTLTNSRSDGASVVTDSQEAYYHGGIDSNGKIRSEFLKLKLTE